MVLQIGTSTNPFQNNEGGSKIRFTLNLKSHVTEKDFKGSSKVLHCFGFVSLYLSLTHTCMQAHEHTPTIFKFEDRNGSSKLPHHHTISRIQTNGQEMNSLIYWIPKNAKQMVKIVTFEETFGVCLLNLPHRFFFFEQCLIG